MKKILAAASALMLMSGAALAESTALDDQPTPFPTIEEMNADVNGIFADEEGNMRSFDDFSTRYVDATDEQRAEVKRICEVYATSEAVTSPRVKSRCQSVADM